MAKLFKNPELTDYFSIIEDVTHDTPLDSIRSYVPDYEDGKVLYFPKLKLDLDFDFWASIPTEEYPGFKKMLCWVGDDQPTLIENAIRKAGGPPELSRPLFKNVKELLDKILPIYYRIFDGYQYSAKKCIFRLNTLYNENIHYDSYKVDSPEQFARMFINLDTQPRIWYTGYTADEIFKIYGNKLSRKVLDTTTSNRFWRELNLAAFGDIDRWYGNQPRHLIYFEPGDVWVVDSRQISHQIFYGRRAVSIDFVVTLDSMLDQKKHYLHLAEEFRKQLLAANPKPPAKAAVAAP